MWDAQNPSPIGEPLTGHSGWVWSVAHSPLGNVIASGSQDKTIRLWDVNTRRQLSAIKGYQPFISVAFSPDAKLIASGCGGVFSPGPSACSVQLWNVQNMTAAANPFKGHTEIVNSVQFSPNGTHVVSGSFDKTIRVWDIERGTTVVGPLKGHTESVRSVAFSPYGSQIVSCSYDDNIRLWDAREGRSIGNPYEGHTYGVHSVAFSPCGTYVASGGNDKTIRIWDVRTGRQVDQPFEEHTSDVYSIAFSPCGQYIVSGSADHNVIIRDVSSKVLDVVDSFDSQTISSQMSTRQMFECLTSTGCIDLSSQMDPKQETAMIVSGGGFGDIWMGRLHSGGKVAIKAWRTNTLERCDYKTLKRAARELFLWSRMDHPNIHRLEGVIMFRDQYLGMVSEWMENGNLHEYLRKYPGADRYQLVVSSDGVARLSDFDFSIMSEVSSLVFSESSNSRSGSIRWAAPEMLLTEAPKRTTQSDVYALGMTMLAREIFTGEVPYPECRQDFTVLTTVARGTLPTRPVERLKADRQGDMMWQLMLRCWNRDVSERPPSGQVFDFLVFYICKAHPVVDLEY
ncbi:tyrosine kinase catalytic domain protein, partial [Rhizoctonia solani AG-3 Rhs1AP]